MDENQRDNDFGNILETRFFRDIHALKLKFRSCTDKRCKACGMMSGEQLDMDAARISKAKRRKIVTRDMSILKNSMLELAAKFDDNYNTGLIK
ncbi:hypothetical protein TNCV_1647451 [Trichonephila clavipes]|nr:hypothetical protein TNCV_1647451 [Trichonephila clavipes]